MLERHAHARQARSAPALLAEDQDLPIRPEPQVGRLDAPPCQGACETVREPVLRRKVVRAREIHRVARDDRLVVGDIAELRLALGERAEAEVGLDPQVGRSGMPFLAVTCAGEHLAHDPRHVDRLRAEAGDAAGDEDRGSVDGDLHAAEGASLAAGGLLHQGVGDGVAQLVRVTGQAELGGVQLRGHAHSSGGDSSAQWSATSARSSRVVSPGVRATPRTIPARVSWYAPAGRPT